MIHLSHNKATGKLAVLLFHFNWCGFKRPVENLMWFLRENSHLPLYGIELSLGDFETKGFKNWIHIHCSESNICFQKEALINLLETYIPEEYTKIAWIDHDIYFENKNWYEEAETALEKQDVIQLFEKACWADERGKVFMERETFLKTHSTQEPWNGHVGFAWAAKREMFRNGGLYSFCPVGHGDTVFAFNILGLSLSENTKMGIGILNNPHYHFSDWSKKISSWCKNIGNISGSVYHHYHGGREGRKYIERSEILNDFIPSKHIRLNYGILQWTDEFKRLREIKKYFQDREEDS